MAIIPPMKTPIQWQSYNCTPSIGWINSPFQYDDINDDDDFCVADDKQQPVKVGNAEGYNCIECHTFYPMAELNFPEGISECKQFKCYNCRKGLKSIF